MKSSEALTLVVIIVVGAALACAGYFLFFGGDGDTALPIEDPKPEIIEAPTDEESSVIAKIEGDMGVNIDEALPTKSETDVGTLLSTVLDPDKKPLKGAKVTLYRSKSPGAFMMKQRMKPLYSEKTDKEGAFSFSPLFPGGGYRLVVDHDFYMEKTLPDLRIREGKPTELPPIIMSLGKTVEGKVRDDNGNPIHGAVVSIYDPLDIGFSREDYVPERMAQTNEKGEYELQFLESSNFIIRATAKGYESSTLRNDEVFTSKSEYEFNFFLAKEMTISGIVVDENDEPIKGAVINALSQISNRPGDRNKQKKPQKGQHHRESYTGVTDKKGEFTVHGLSKGFYYLSAIHEMYSTLSSPHTEAGMEDVRFVLKRRSGISGQVVNSEQKPITKYWLNAKMVSRAPDGWATRERKRRYNDGKGRFIFDGLDPGKYVIEVVAKGYAPFTSEPIKVEQEYPTTDIVFELNKGGIITGQVFNPDGDPLRRVRVSLRRNNYRPNPVENFFGVDKDTKMHSTRTNAKGEYKIFNVVAGVYQIEFDHTNYPPSRINDIKVELDETVYVDPQTMKLGASLEGTVFNDANSPLPEAKVTIHNENHTIRRSATCDQNGYYKITNIPPGTYRVSPLPKIDMEKNPFEVLGPALKSEVIEVEILEGETKQLTLIVYS